MHESLPGRGCNVRKNRFSVAVIVAKSFRNEKMRELPVAGYVALRNFFRCNLSHNKFARQVAQNVAKCFTAFRDYYVVV